MGAGASSSSRNPNTALDEFGAFGDAVRVRSLCEELDYNFDPAKFDALKDEDGFVTQEQLRKLFDAHALGPIEEQTAAGVPGAGGTGTGGGGGDDGGDGGEAVLVRCPASGLVGALEVAEERGLTALVIDATPNHVVDTFFGYKALMLDAKQLSLSVAMKKMTPDAAREKARGGIVQAMQKGAQCIVAMQQGCPSFHQWFDSPNEFPCDDLFTNGGHAFLEDRALPERVMREADKAKDQGFAICRPGFRVVLTTWFAEGDVDEYLFDPGKPLSKVGKGKFQKIVLVEE